MIKQRNWLKTISLILLFAILVYLIWNLQTLIVYVLISGIISIIANPLVDYCDKIKYKKISIPRGLSAILSLVLTWGIIIGIMSIVIPIFSDQVSVLSNLDYDKIWQKIQEPISSFDAQLRYFGVLTGDGAHSVDVLKGRIKEMLNISDLALVFSSIINGLGNLFVAFFSISFISFFFIKEKGMFVNILFALIPSNYKSESSAVLAKSKTLLSRYFLGVLLQISIIFMLLFTSLALFGVKSAFLIAIFAAIINIIPYVGPFIGAFVGILIAITTGLDTIPFNELLPLAGTVAGVFLVVQLLDNIIFQPYIFSNSVHAHPLEIFLVISIAGTLGGITSMILAIPLYTVIRIIAKEFLSQFKIVQDLTDNI